MSLIIDPLYKIYCDFCEGRIEEKAKRWKAMQVLYYAFALHPALEAMKKNLDRRPYWPLYANIVPVHEDLLFSKSEFRVHSSDERMFDVMHS